MAHQLWAGTAGCDGRRRARHPCPRDGADGRRAARARGARCCAQRRRAATPTPAATPREGSTCCSAGSRRSAASTCRRRWSCTDTGSWGPGLHSAVRSGRPDVIFEWSERARHLSLQVVPLRPPPDETLADDLAELRMLRADDDRWLANPRAAELQARARERQWSATGSAAVHERASLERGAGRTRRRHRHLSPSSSRATRWGCWSSPRPALPVHRPRGLGGCPQAPPRAARRPRHGGIHSREPPRRRRAALAR